MIKQIITHPNVQFSMEIDSYKLQKLPMFNYVVTNSKYEGIMVIDPWQGVAVTQINFDKDYSQSGIIDEWCFRADGKALLVINREYKIANLIYLEPSISSCVLFSPLFEKLENICYVWDKDSFWMVNSKLHKFFELEWQDSIPFLKERSGIEARIAHRYWRRVVDQLLIKKNNILRVEPDNFRILYHNYSAKPERIGAINWHSGIEFSVSAPNAVPRLALYERKLFVLHEYEAHMLNEEGQIEKVYPVPESFHYSGLDTLPAQNGQPAALVLTCNSLMAPRCSQFLIYHLNG